MLASTPQPPRDYSASPSFRRRQRISAPSKPYESPLLTPLRRVDRASTDDLDEFFLQSPFKSPMAFRSPLGSSMPLSRGRSDSPADISMASPLFTLPPKPLLTPVKQQTPLAFDFGDDEFASPIIPLSVGVKRKSGASQSTPFHQHAVTPLKLTSPRNGAGFDRLSRPTLSVQTPQSSKAEVDAHLRKQTASMTKLRIADFDDSDDDLLVASDTEDGEHAIFLGGKLKAGPLALASNDKASPGGVKRRKEQARTSVKRVDRSPSPSPKPLQVRKSINDGPRRRKSSLHTSVPTSKQQTRQTPIFKAPLPKAPIYRQGLNRVDSATLFFGPSVSSPQPCRVPSTKSKPLSPAKASPRLNNRHSFAAGCDTPWNTIQNTIYISPPSSPLGAARAAEEKTDYVSTDDDMDFEPFAADSSFSFSMTGSPDSKSDEAIPTKYRPRDSGVVLSDDEEWSRFGDPRSIMPGTSTSVNSVFSDDGLVTPVLGPGAASGWPAPNIADFIGDTSVNAEDDAMILRTLATASRPGPEEGKKIPGTPVKKVKTAYMSGNRPWQSAVARKVVSVLDTESKKGKVPRKSMPSAFPLMGRKALDSDSEEEDSPSNRKKKYPDVGMGRPSAAPAAKDGLFPKARWLMRRSSSGGLSNDSGSASSRNVTPVRSSKERFVKVPRISAQGLLSPGRSASGSSTSTLNSPTLARKSVLSGFSRRSPASRSSLTQEQGEERLSRFERDFVALDEIGHGEFGRVLKARLKGDDQSQVFAVKQSKRFEGMKHRLRLREEVQVLEHLSLATGGRSHANVLGFVDSWEEEECLYIRTELCELGNLARFLWEYGKVNPHLDEARVWKIIADLSNGLQFIHNAGVIHLDIKPSNIFVTGEGRFKIGDFGMASIWPRPPTMPKGNFEREGDKLYLAPEVLQGHYGKAADIFGFGMTLLETAANIVVPEGGEAWHRLRMGDFVQVEWPSSPQLFELIQQMMRRDPEQRVTAREIWTHPVVSRARIEMEEAYAEAVRLGASTFAASPLASVREDFLEDILAEQSVAEMDISF